ncbi:MAG: DUF4296 domain-containing protein [Parabacteroides sp.]|nr:DUF4296 domain-containing protein [Parabacteroides sp.]
MQKRRNLVCFLGFGLLLVFAAACSKAPSGILSERKMKDVLVDMQLAEAVIGTNYKEYADAGKKEALFRSVFKKHGITQAEYDSSLVWYGRNLDVYMKVYDVVLAELNQRKKELGDIQPDASPSSNQDSVNVWNRFSYLTFLSDAPYNGVYFDFVPAGGYPAGSAFVLSFDVWGLHRGMTVAPEVRLSLEQPDTTVTEMRYITHDGLSELAVRGKATEKVKRVYGYIRLQKSDDVFYKVYIDRIRLIKYNYGTGFSLHEHTAEPLIFPNDTLWAERLRLKRDSVAAKHGAASATVSASPVPASGGVPEAVGTGSVAGMPGVPASSGSSDASGVKK